MPKHWFPLESNPEVMTMYAHKLGLDTAPSSGLWFHDVLSTEDWAFAMVPSPVLAVLMLFPIKEKSEAFNKEEAARIAAHGQAVSPNLYFMKQTVGNACGTVAILHSILNNKSHRLTHIQHGSFIDKMVTETAHMTPDQRAAYLNNDDSIESFHEEAASTGQSEVAADVDSHFVCFTCVDDALYELDGRKASAVNHGPCTPDTLLMRACEAVRGFMARDEGELGFTIVALARAGSIDDIE